MHTTTKKAEEKAGMAPHVFVCKVLVDWTLNR